MRELANAFRVAQSDEGLDAAFPDPEPLIGMQDDEWDRSPIW